MLKVMMVNKDFDMRFKDGIGRVAHELYSRVSRSRDLEVTPVSLADLSNKRELKDTSFVNLAKHFIKERNGLKRELKRAKPDIVHAMAPDHAYVLSMRTSAVRIVTWHDSVLFERERTAGSLLKKAKYMAKMRIWKNAYKNADIVISVSSKTQEEVIGQYGYDRDKRYFVVPNGVSGDVLRTKVWNGDRRDFIYVGSVEYANKNIPGLLALFAEIRKELENAKLHVFSSTPDAQGILDRACEDAGLPKDGIVLHFRKQDRDLYRAMSRCAALLYLSRSEGVGMPILEATAMGTPALVLDSARIPQEVTKYAYKGGPDELRDIAIGLATSKNSVSKAAVEYARGFTWDRAAEKLLEIYRSAK